MANRFLDSFDHYATADFAKKYNSYGAQQTITSSAGRTANGLTLLSNGNTGFVQNTFDEQGTWTVGFAVQFTQTGTGSTILVFYTNTSTPTIQLCVCFTAGNTLIFADSSLNQLGAVATPALSLNVWYYIEVQVVFGASISANTCLIKVNTVTQCNLPAGTKTAWTSGVTTASGICLGNPVWSGVFAKQLHAVVDDYYINDGTGTTNNSFLGDITVDAMFTNAIGTYQDLTVVGTTTSVLATTDRAPDGDTTYVWTSTANNRESFTYTLPNYSITTVYAVQLLNCVEKSSAGTRSVVPFVRSGITNYEQASVSVSTGYLYTISTIELNPATGVAWTETDVRSIESGIRVS